MEETKKDSNDSIVSKDDIILGKEKEENPFEENLTAEGLYYIDEETGEKKLIPRCDELGKYDYKYTEKQMQYKIYLQKECFSMYPNIDPAMIEIYIDFFLKHPEKMEALLKNDKKYKKNIIDE